MEIQVNDKVKWVQWRGETPVEFSGRVENISSFNGVKTFVIEKFGTFPEDRTETTISASRVTKIGE
tara:strand:- start:785 stop:982 length:198 start_codon:yes stop_codon:yes gene_type:complete